MANEVALSNTRKAIAAYDTKIASYLPGDIDPKRFLAVAWQAVQKNPKLAECSQDSFTSAMLTSAITGLLPDGKKAALVPFGNEVTFIPMVEGLIELAYKTPLVKEICAEPVYPGDLFEIDLGTNKTLIHKPNFMAERTTPILFYCIIRLTTGGTVIEPMTKAEVDAIRLRSRSGTSGPWKTDYNEMAKKTVIKRALKRIPKNTELMRALAYDNYAETGERGPYCDEPEPRQKGTSAEDLKEKLKAKTPTAADAEFEEVPTDDPPPSPGEPAPLF